MVRNLPAKSLAKKRGFFRHGGFPVFPICRLVLDNGLPCQGPALHNQPYCRHHTPEALARHQGRRPARPDTSPASDSAAEPEAEAQWTPAQLRAYWRMHHRIIAAAATEDDCQEIFEMILEALGQHDISPRSAGSLLQAIMDRRKALAAQAQEAAFRVLEERVNLHRRQVAQGLAPDDRAALEALANAFPSATAPASTLFEASEKCRPVR